jgi:hypothetical protein
MIPYSSTNPAFFTKLHFNFFRVFGSMSKLGLDNGLSLYMSPTPPSYFSHQINIIIIIIIIFLFFPFYDSLLLHKPGIFYKTSFRFFLNFWEHFKTWGAKLDVLKVLPAKAKKHRVGNRWRSDVDMVRWLRCHMAHLNVGPCSKASR